MINPAGIYQQRIDYSLLETRKIKRRLHYIPWLRFLFFLAIICSIYFSVKTAGSEFIVAAGILFAGFLISGWLDFNLKQKIKTLETRIEINRQEIGAIEGDFSVFEPGVEFFDENHPYTDDLDIFGKGSLFQCLNRSVTIFGKRRLAEYLNNAYLFRNEILSRQQAIKELSEQIDFRQELQRIFFEKQTKDNDLTILMEWLGSDTAVENQPDIKTTGLLKFMKVISYAGPGVTIASIVLACTGLVHYQLPISMILLQILIVYAFGRRTQMIHQKITSLFRILEKYAQALFLIEKASFNITFNKALQDDLKLNQQDPPSRIIRRFSRLLKWMDENLNLIFSVIMNGFFMFNIHMLIAVEEWRLKYRNLIPKWFAVLAEFDALSGIAAFSFNNQEFVFPEVNPGEYMLKAVKIGHPLIPVDTCVTNDFEIGGWKQFYIITGANMSGKSTFLRAIGTNYILAMMGAPVFAEKFIFTPIEIHSSIRTKDSLVKGESYFYAELKCLKEIIQELEQGRRKLILLDEILKGTNSSDKQSGSIALIKQLMNYNVAGIFATHDIAISTLINIYPDNIRNLCFEISIENDRMEIDYKLRPGVCKNLNASYLMKKMGIVLE
jgi:hypothetical protein